MNGARWDSLNDEQKSAFSRAATKAVTVSRDYVAKADVEGRTTLAKSMEVNEIDSAAFQAAAIPVWDEIAKAAGGNFGTRVIAFVTAK